MFCESKSLLFCYSHFVLVKLLKRVSGVNPQVSILPSVCLLCPCESKGTFYIQQQSIIILSIIGRRYVQQFVVIPGILKTLLLNLTSTLFSVCDLLVAVGDFTMI